jgi:hypothetical protein
MTEAQKRLLLALADALMNQAAPTWMVESRPETPTFYYVAHLVEAVKQEG